MINIWKEGSAANINGDISSFQYILIMIIVYSISLSGNAKEIILKYLIMEWRTFI